MTTDNLARQQKNTASVVKTAPRSRVTSAYSHATLKPRWIAQLKGNKDFIAEAVVIVLLFATIIGAFYFGSVYGASL